MTNGGRLCFALVRESKHYSHTRTALIVLFTILAVAILGFLPTNGAQAATAIYLTPGTSTDTTINVSWFSTGLTGVTEYRVYYGYTISSMNRSITCPASASATTVTGLLPKVQYCLKVRAYTSATAYIESTVRTVSTLAPPVGAPTAPTGLTASAASQSKISLTWKDNSSNESGFKIERASSANGPFTPLTSTTIGVTSYSDSSCSPSTTYYYRVCAYNTTGVSAYSNIANATTPAALPSPPAAPSALGGYLLAAGQVKLVWTDNANNETGFTLERSTSQSTGFAAIAWPAAGSTTCVDATIGNAPTYYYRILATNAGGSSAYSNVASVSTVTAPPPPPTAPSGLSLASISSGQVSLLWVDNSDNETGFSVERSTSSSGSFSQVAPLGANTTTWTDSTVIAGTTYYYRVCAIGDSGNSGYSNILSATPPVPLPADPSNLTATAASTSQINLAWSDTSSNEQGFEIWRSVGNASSFAYLNKVAANTKTYTDNNLASSTTYYYEVRAYNTSGNSGWSNNDHATTGTVPPAAPTGLKSTALASNKVDLQWTDTSSDETGFTVERGVSGVFGVIATLGAGATTYSDTTVASGSSYSYRVASFNGGGSSTYSNTLNITTPQAAPANPSGLTATTLSTSQIRLDWVDNSNNETGFKLERSPSGLAGTFVALSLTIAANAVTCTDTTCLAGTTYYYQVKAKNAVGDSAPSNIVSATTNQSVPAAPTSLTWSGLTSNSVNLSWTDNSSNEDGFIVERSSTNATGSFVQVGSQIPANVKTASDAGLTPSTTYYYRVCAVNSGGKSTYSNTIAVTTSSAPPTPPTAPDKLTATAVSTSQINLAWSDNSNNETGFRIERGTSDAGPFTYLNSTGAGIATYSDTSLPQATKYYYRVLAYNSVANSTYSNVASDTTKTVPPAAPSTLAAKVVSVSQVDLTWKSNSTNETNFVVERSLSSTSGFAQIFAPSAGATAWSDTTVSGGTTYYYRVYATNLGGNSGYSNIVNATTPPGKPNDPSNLTANAVSFSEIDLSWTRNSTNETGFKIERADGTSGNWQQVAVVALPLTSWANTGLTCPGSYSYRVRAYSTTGGDSGYSNTATTSVVLPVPTGLTLGMVTENQVSFSWTPVAASITGYKVLMSMYPDFNFSEVRNIVGTPPAAVYTSDPNLYEDTTYYFQVLCYNAGGVSDVGTISAVTKLKKPTDLVCTKFSATEVDLQWTDNSNAEKHYVIERMVDGSDWGEIATLDSNSTTYQDKTCVPETLYHYRVQATGSVSDYSNTLDVTTGKPKPVPSPQLKGFLSDIGSVVGVVTGSDNMVYVASDPFGLVIVNASNPAQPVVVGSQHPNGPALQVAVSEQRKVAVAVGTPRGTDIIDISHPEYPTVAQSIGGNSVDATISGNYAYVAGAGGLKIIDITSAQNAYVVATVATPGSGYGVAVSDNKVAVVCDPIKGLAVIDVTNPVNPGAPKFVTLGGRAWKVAISGNTAYVANYSGYSVQAVDITDRNNPVLLPTSIPTGACPQNISISSPYAFVSLSASGVLAVDISNPRSLSLAAQLAASDLGCTPQSCAVRYGLAYLAAGPSGMRITNIQDMTAPVAVTVLSGTSNSTQVAASDTVAVSVGTIRGTDIIDITDHSRPTIAKSIAGNSVDAAISGNYAYVAGAGGLKIIDITSPQNAYVAATVATPGSGYGVAVSDNKVAVVCDPLKGLAVIDVTNPVSPGAPVYVTLGGRPWKVAVSGNTAYVANFGAAKVQAVDITDRNNPVLLPGYVSLGVNPLNISVSGNNAFVSASSGGLFVIDITNPAAISLTTVYAGDLLRVNPQSSAVADGYLFVAGNTGGFSILDITDIYNPVLTGLCSGLGSTQDIITYGGYVFTADGKSEMNIFKMYR